MISIILVTKNQKNLTEECLKSIIKKTRTPYEIIVVDNASEDGTPQFLVEFAMKNQHVKFKIDLQKVNHGFSKGNNLGLRLAEGEFILILNNDTIVTENWDTNFINCFNHRENVGAVGPRTNYAGSQQIIPDLKCKSMEEIELFSKILNEKNRGKYNEVRRLAGFCIFTKREVLDKVGFFDDSFGIGYFEDDDLILRMQMNGYLIIQAEDIYIHHYGNMSFKGNNVNSDLQMIRNANVFKHKWQNESKNELVAHFLKYVEIQISLIPIKKTLSLCMIVKNEEKNIADALRSIIPVADEIIVVDTGSTDRTREIVAQFDCKLDIFEWKNDYSLARNFSISKATGEWIMYIDADERLSVKDQNHLLDVICNKECFEKYDGIRLIQRNYSKFPHIYSWKECTGIYEEEKDFPGFTDIQITRIFKNRPEIKFSNLIHEHVEDSILKLKGLIGFADIPLHHYGFDESFEKTKEKNRIYLSLVEAKYVNNPEDPNTLLEYGMSLAFNEKQTEALEILKEAASKNPNNCMAFQTIAIIHQKQKQLVEAEFFFRKAITIKPDSVPNYIGLATTLMEAGNLDEAERILKILIDGEMHSVKFYELLYNVLFNKNKFDECITYLERGMKHFPLNAFFPYNLANVYYQKGIYDQALSCLDKTVLLAKEGSEYKNKILAFKELLRHDS